MATKTIYRSINEVKLSGVIVKEDARINDKGTFASFRMAHSRGRDRNGVERDSIFKDVVMFASDSQPIPAALLKKGAKIVVTGYVDINKGSVVDPEKPVRTFERIVANSIVENKPEEVEVPDNANSSATAEDAPAPAPAASEDADFFPPVEELEF